MKKLSKKNKRKYETQRKKMKTKKIEKDKNGSIV